MKKSDRVGELGGTQWQHSRGAENRVICELGEREVSGVKGEDSRIQHNGLANGWELAGKQVFYRNAMTTCNGPTRNDY